MMKRLITVLTIVGLMAVTNFGVFGCGGGGNKAPDPDPETAKCTIAPKSFVTTISMDTSEDVPICMSVLGGSEGNFDLGLSIVYGGTDFGSINMLDLMTTPKEGTSLYGATMDLSSTIISDIFTVIDAAMADATISALIAKIAPEDVMAYLNLLEPGDARDNLVTIVNDMLTKLNEGVLCTAAADFACTDLSDSTKPITYNCVYSIKPSDFKADALAILDIVLAAPEMAESKAEAIEMINQYLRSDEAIEGKMAIPVTASNEECTLTNYITLIQEIINGGGGGGPAELTRVYTDKSTFGTCDEISFIFKDNLYVHYTSENGDNDLGTIRSYDDVSELDPSNSDTIIYSSDDVDYTVHAMDIISITHDEKPWIVLTGGVAADYKLNAVNWYCDFESRGDNNTADFGCKRVFSGAEDLYKDPECSIEYRTLVSEE